MVEEYTKEELARHNLLCDAMRSRFYHNSFERRYSRWSQTILLLMGAISISSIAFFSQGNQYCAAILGVMAAGLAYLDVLWRPAHKASVHCYKGNRFAELFNRIERNESPSKKDILLWKELRHEIEGGDGSVFHVLNHICQNRVIDCLGLDESYKRHINGWQKWWCYVKTYETHDIPYVKNPSTSSAVVDSSKSQ